MSPRTFALSWAILLPAIAWAGWGSASPMRAIGLGMAGLLVWSLFEYAMHRFIFHWKSDIAAVRWLVYLIHGNHHETPGDPMRGLMPLPVSVTVGGGVWLLCLAALGNAGTWLFLGFMTGYVLYDGLHFACHQLPMRGRIGSALKRHHMRHHHIDDDGNFAISAIFWDRVFGSRIATLKR